MKLRDFIKQNRKAIDEYINQQVGRVPRTASCYCSESGTDHQHAVGKRNDEERRQWVLNDEPLYRWARQEGVKC